MQSDDISDEESSEKTFLLHRTLSPQTTTKGTLDFSLCPSLPPELSQYICKYIADPAKSAFFMTCLTTNQDAAYWQRYKLALRAYNLMSCSYKFMNKFRKLHNPLIFQDYEVSIHKVHTIFHTYATMCERYKRKKRSDYFAAYSPHHFYTIVKSFIGSTGCYSLHRIERRLAEWTENNLDLRKSEIFTPVQFKHLTQDNIKAFFHLLRIKHFIRYHDSSIASYSSKHPSLPHYLAQGCSITMLLCSAASCVMSSVLTAVMPTQSIVYYASGGICVCFNIGACTCLTLQCSKHEEASGLCCCFFCMQEYKHKKTKALLEQALEDLEKR